MRPSTCFISYCHDDVDETCIKELLYKLRDACIGIKYNCDIENQPGVSINEFMKNVLTNDTIVVICSPKYKQKINDPTSRIYTEFNYLKQRYARYQEICHNSSSPDELALAEFAIIPIMINVDGVKVSYEDAYPDWFQETLSLVCKRYTYLSQSLKSNLRTLKTKGVKLSAYEKNLIQIKNNRSKIESDNADIIRTIVSQSISLNSQRPITDPTLPLNARRARLIVNTKAEDNGRPIGALYCKTKFYQDLVDQVRIVFVGRKGSGKTETIIQFCSENQDKYKGVIKINANDIKFEHLLNMLLYKHESWDSNINTLIDIDKMNIEAVKADLNDIFSYEEFLRYTWVGFIYLCTIYRIACETHLTQYQLEQFKSAKNFMNKILKKIPSVQRYIYNPPQERTIYAGLYDYAFAKCIEFYNHIINNSRTDDITLFNSDITFSNSASNFVNYLLGNRVRKSLAMTISQCTKKIFISLDGFDNIQEEKKGNRIKLDGQQIDNALISKFESAWILSLVNVSKQIRTSNDMGLYELNDKLDVCLMIPFDRYMQITYYKRDGFVYRDLMTSAVYKGHDLFDMYLKRTWFIANDHYREINNSLDRNELSKDVINCYSNLPNEIIIRLNNNNTIKFPLFLYLLRYTFWRPRDVIDYIGAIFSALFDSNDNKVDYQITEESVKNGISLCSKKIIKKIIEEFKDVWLNIVESLNKFNYADAVMSYDEFSQLLRDTGFAIKLIDQTLSNVNDIIKFLYEIGIIGLFLSPKNKTRAHTKYSQHQVFYSGRKPLATLGEDIFAENSIFFNPTMFSLFNMKVRTDEILGIDSWQTLEELDRELDYDYLNTPV